MGIHRGEARDAATHLTGHRLQMAIVPRLGSPDLINVTQPVSPREIM